MQKTKQAEKNTKEQPYEVTPLDYQILLYVREYHFLTAWQLVKLHYSDGSLTRARVILLRLYDAGYLDRCALPHVGAGQPTYIYALATKGINYLREQGYTSCLTTIIFAGALPHGKILPGREECLMRNLTHRLTALQASPPKVWGV